MDNPEVQILPLKRSDAFTSVHWRNNPKIWELTTNTPNKLVTIEDELRWIEKVLSDRNSVRFSIHYRNQYVGNIQLTEIKNRESYFGIFIGETKLWGRGIASKAILLILQYGFDNLQLKRIKLRVKVCHIKAYELYRKIGFEEIERDSKLIYMEIHGKK